MASSAGFEPTAFRLGGGRSILLSYWRISAFWALRGVIVPHFGKKVNGAGKSTEFFFPNGIY